VALEQVVACRLEASARPAEGAGRYVEDGRTSSPFMAILKPPPSAPRRLATGTRQSSKITIAVGCVFQPSFFSRLRKTGRRASFSTTRQEMPFGPGSAGPSHHRHIDVTDPAAGDERLGPVEHVIIAGRASRGSPSRPQHPSRCPARSGQ